jgi:uncharacterized protein (TIGR02001 family)
MAADGWGGSLDFSSDYLVRGISRTEHDPALQVELHYLNSSGLIAGAFASNSQFEKRDARDVELSAFLGYAWHPVEDWSGRFLYSHYAYPWNRRGREYDYDEIDAVLSYRGWLQFSLNYSPNTPRYLMWPIDALKGESERSVELNLQRPVAKHLGVIGGVGYSYLGGPRGGGYVYWSAGAAYSFGSLSFSLLFVDTSSEAKALFYNAAAVRRVLGTAVWRF